MTDTSIPPPAAQPPDSPTNLTAKAIALAVVALLGGGAGGAQLFGGPSEADFRVLEMKVERLEREVAAMDKTADSIEQSLNLLLDRRRANP